MTSIHVDLKGKVAVITGGGGVLCSEFARALSSAGAKVAILNRTKEKGDRVAEELVQLGGQAISIQADVLDKSSLQKARVEINSLLGPCDILINGAGGNHKDGTTTNEFFEQTDLEKEEIKTFFDLDAEGIGYVFDLNFMGTLLPSQVFAKDMIGRENCTIINVSSMNAFTPLTKIPAYSGAKAAINNFTQWLAVHMSKVGIRVNAIAPGFFLTEQNKALLTTEDGFYTERAKKILSQTPFGRFGQKEELRGTILYLADSNASRFVTGVVIPVDGGFSAYSGV